jgi:hypothetical protein
VYATSGYRLVDPELNLQTVRFFLLRGLTIPVVFLLTIGIYFFSVSIAIYCWLLLVGSTLSSSAGGGSRRISIDLRDPWKYIHDHL